MQYFAIKRIISGLNVCGGLHNEIPCHMIYDEYERETYVESMPICYIICLVFVFDEGFIIKSRNVSLLFQQHSEKIKPILMQHFVVVKDWIL